MIYWEKGKKGKARDREIIDVLESWHVLNTYQLKIIFFPDSGLRMAQKRLKLLFTQEKLMRGRDSLETPYYYFTDKTKAVDHEYYIKMAWVLLWLMKWGEKIFSVDYKESSVTQYNPVNNKTTKIHIVFNRKDAEKYSDTGLTFMNGMVTEVQNSVLVIDDRQYKKIMEGFMCEL